MTPNQYQFPYVRFHGKHYPLLPITLRHGRKFVNTFALLDSGASVSLFRPEIAKALGLSRQKNSSMRLDTASGRVSINISKVTVEIEQTKFSANIGFSTGFAASFNILGRESFFRRFSICFNEAMKTIILVPIRSLKT